MVVDKYPNSLQEIIQSQDEGRGRIQALRLFHDMFGMEPESTISREDLRNLLSSALLASEHIDEISADGGYRSVHASFGAEVLEDIGSVFPEPQEPSVLSFLTYSSLNYQLTRKFANAKLLAESALEKFPDAPESSATPDNFRLTVHKAVLYFLATRLEELKAITNQDNTHRIAQDMVGRIPISELSSGLMLLRSLDNFGEFIRGDNQANLDAAILDLERARQLGTSELLIGELADWLKSIYSVSVAHYAPRFLGKYQCLPEGYLRSLLSGPKSAFWLWPSQTGALEAGLFDRDAFAVSMPPSAGKTFLAELKIVQRIANTEKLAFYVVPLNALARQVQAELSNRLRRPPLRMNVRVLTGAYELSDEDLAAAGVQESVVVTTPEKLDGLMRNLDRADIKSMFDRADLFVFDECQNIGSGKRGVTLEMLIERVRFLKPGRGRPFSVQAAFFTNIRKLCTVARGSIVLIGYLDDWRPTKAPGRFLDQRRQPTDRSAMVLSRGIRGPIMTRKMSLGSLIDLQRVYRNVLVVSTSRDTAEKYADALSYILKYLSWNNLTFPNQETRRLKMPLSDAIRREIHPQARLADYVGVRL